MSQRGKKSNFKAPLWAKQIDRPREYAPPPAHLGKAEKEIWQRVLEEFDIDEHPVKLALLSAALEAHERARNCREQVIKDGHLIKGKGGVWKAHPLLGVERAARQQTVATLRKLGVHL